MRRSYVIGLVGLAIVLFLVISAFLARAFSVGDAEQAAITDLVKAEARGDTARVISMVSGCSAEPACRARASALTSTLRHAGAVRIAVINPSSTFSITSTLGTARVAWLAGSSLPRTQCVRVRHAGSVVQGFTVQLLKVSLRIVTDAACPKSF